MAFASEGWRHCHFKYTDDHRRTSCIATVDSGYRPAIPFDSWVVSRLASINASIDVDLYVLPNDGDEHDYRI